MNKGAEQMNADNILDPILKQRLEHAMKAQQDNQLDEAILLYNKVLTQDPNNADALHGLGLSYAQLNQTLKAIAFFKKAVQTAPTVPAFHNNLANAYKKTNQFEPALAHYFEALKLKSPYPEVHNNLGGLYYQQGKLPEAIAQFEKSIRMQPQRADTHYNLANCYIQSNRLLEAIPHFQEVLKQKPDHIGAAHNLGIALTALKNFNTAKPLLEQVVQADPNNIEALFHLGIIEASLGLPESILAAQTYYKRVLALNPKHGDTHHNLATLYLHQKNKTKALEHYQCALQVNPNNLTAQHMIHALTGVATQTGAPPEYIRALFDQYAYNYDSHLKEQLGYQVPLLLREAVGRFGLQFENALDLGCGTGLCAPYFRDITGKLTGVDLSPNMIEIASQQGGYDKLAVAEIQDYLAQNSQNKIKFDLMIAADVFVYFSDLSLIFKQCYDALMPKGLFCFSVESHAGLQPYLLQPCGRYSHHIETIKKILTELGFELTHESKSILRTEEDKPVWGVIMLIRKYDSVIESR